MRSQRVDHLELEVGQRTQRQRDAAVGQRGHERRVVDAGVAVVQPVDPKQVQRLAHIGRRPLLARVGHHLEAQGPAAAEELGELGRRVADLGTAQAEAQQAAVPGLERVQHRQAFLLAAVPLHHRDEPAGDAVFIPCRRHGAEHAVHHRGDRHTAAGVALGAEEELRMQHAVGVRAAQVVARHVVEVLRRLQHAATVVVQVEEVLQVLEVVGGPQLLYRLPADGHAVAACQFDEALGFDRALDVHMELGLGQARHEVADVHLRGPCTPWRPR